MENLPSAAGNTRQPSQYKPKLPINRSPNNNAYFQGNINNNCYNAENNQNKPYKYNKNGKFNWRWNFLNRVIAR